MKPKKSPAAELSQFQLFHSRLEQLVNPNHELIQLAELIDCRLLAGHKRNQGFF